MKGHGIIQLMAMIALKRAGVRLTRDLVFIGNADEEIGGLGTRTFIRDHPDLVRGIEYVLTESGDTRVEQGRVRWFGVGVGEKRTWWKAITAHGTASHASVPTGNNPVARLVRVLNRIAGWETPVPPHAGGRALLQEHGPRRDRPPTDLAGGPGNGTPKPGRPSLAARRPAPERAAPEHHHPDGADGLLQDQRHSPDRLGGAGYPAAAGPGHRRLPTRARASHRRFHDHPRVHR